MRYDNQLTVLKQYFTNTAAMQNMGYQQIWPHEIYGGHITDTSQYHNAGTDMEHGLKDITSHWFR